jgi:DNA-binding transcriptional regulator of glucitol operon
MVNGKKRQADGLESSTVFGNFSVNCKNISQSAHIKSGVIVSWKKKILKKFPGKLQLNTTQPNLIKDSPKKICNQSEKRF